MLLSVTQKNFNHKLLKNDNILPQKNIILFIAIYYFSIVVTMSINYFIVIDSFNRLFKLFYMKNEFKKVFYCNIYYLIFSQKKNKKNIFETVIFFKKIKFLI